MPEFTVLACDLITGVTLDELPVKPSTITWDLNGPGSISDLTIPASALRGRDPNDVQVALSEGRTAIYIDMDGALIWGGPLWRKVYSSVTRAYTLTVGGWWSYWQRQLITTALQFRGADQFDIVRTLLSLRNGEPGFVPIIMSAADSGVVRNYSWEVGDLKGVGEAIEQMSDNIGGFEFVVDVRRNVDTGRPERVLRIGSPGSVPPGPRPVWSWSTRRTRRPVNGPAMSTPTSGCPTGPPWRRRRGVRRKPTRAPRSWSRRPRRS
jgi:hypothetical protein